MGYRKASVQILEDLIVKGAFQDFENVIELGSQDIEDDLLCDYANAEADLNGRVSAKYIFSKIGFSKYCCIDFDGAHDALPFDLNLDIVHDYGFNRQFDLVTSLGTTEHVFNQAAVFRNIHNLCKQGGVMLIGTPMQGWHNHGFYNYNPKFFYKLAIRNHYHFLGAWIYDSMSGFVVELNSLGDEKTLMALNGFENLRSCDQKGLSITVAFKKTIDKEFLLPVDGDIFVDDIADTYYVENKFKDALSLLGYGDIKKVAVFGTGRAGKIAERFFASAGVEIVCFIDDFQEDLLPQIPIVNWEKFVNIFQSQCSHIIKGPGQSGDLANRKALNISIVEMYPSWL